MSEFEQVENPAGAQSAAGVTQAPATNNRSGCPTCSGNTGDVSPPCSATHILATHAQVALRKIQLRYIRREAMPHSPFRDEDRSPPTCSYFERQKTFDAYTASTLPTVRYNPGKHSN